MFHSFGSVCSFFLSIVMCEDVDDGHEVNLLLHSTWCKDSAFRSVRNGRVAEAGREIPHRRGS